MLTWSLLLPPQRKGTKFLLQKIDKNCSHQPLKLARLRLGHLCFLCAPAWLIQKTFPLPYALPMPSLVSSKNGKREYGNRHPIDGRNPIRKFSIDPLCPQNQWDNSDSTNSPRQRIKEKSRYGNSVSTPHRRYGHRLRTPFLQTLFPRLLSLVEGLQEVRN